MQIIHSLCCLQRKNRILEPVTILSLHLEIGLDVGGVAMCLELKIRLMLPGTLVGIVIFLMTVLLSLVTIAHRKCIRCTENVTFFLLNPPVEK